MSTEPRTEAGRRLFTDNEPGDMPESNGVTWGDVAAIEDEARSLALREVAATIRSLTARGGKGHGGCVAFVAAMDAISALREGTKA